jgi:hypothetical protein
MLASLNVNSDVLIRISCTVALGTVCADTGAANNPSIRTAAAIRTAIAMCFIDSLPQGTRRWAHSAWASGVSIDISDNRVEAADGA